MRSEYVWLALVAVAGAGVGASIDGSWWAWTQLALLVVAAVMVGRRTAQADERARQEATSSPR